MLITSDAYLKKYGNRPACAYCKNYSLFIIYDDLGRNKIPVCGKHSIQLIQEISLEAARKTENENNVEN